MELFPIYDETAKISANIWYSISGIGENPFMRVGHSIVHINQDPTDKTKKGKLYFIGGANPSGSFNDLYIFDLDTLSWDKLDDIKNFEKGRYEHSCFLDKDNKIYVFGGSSETDGTLNEIIKFDVDKKECEKLKNDSPNVPAPRTIHSAASYKNQLFIFGGGSAGKSPIEDQKVYIFNPTSNRWISLSPQGTSPSCRQGHVLVNYGDCVYLHGGMKDETIFDDLWVFNLKNMTWSEIDHKSKGVCPSSRAAHGAANINESLYVFGGVNKDGLALDDLWRYHIDSNQWSLIEIFGYKPPPRLDFAYSRVCFYSHVKDDSQEAESRSDANNQDTKLCHFFMIHGGMDTEGNIFDDFFYSFRLIFLIK